MPSWLWPIKTGQVVADAWTVIHFCFWVIVGGNYEAIRIKYSTVEALSWWWLPYALTLFFALAWEVFEQLYMEPHGYVRHPEIWFNRWLSDPTIGLAGTCFGLWLIKHQ